MKEAARRGTIRKVVVSRFLALLSVLVLCGCQGSPSRGPITMTGTWTPSPPGYRESVEYDVRASLKLVNEGPGQPSKQNLWMALVQDQPPYQSVLSTDITPSDYQIITDEYGNRYAEFELSDMPPGTTVPIEAAYRVKVQERTYDLGGCTGDLADEFLQAELHIESNNVQIIELSRELAQGKETVCDQVRAMYDWVGNHLVYSYNGADWGAQAALGEMGADCTEYASLLVALTRAAGIPARYVEGLWAHGEEVQVDARAEHAWLEVYLPGAGWTPMDPTLGRSSTSREAYFAHLPPDHIVVTMGRNPSTLRGASYWSHLYWPGASTVIRAEGFGWEVTPVSQ